MANKELIDSLCVPPSMSLMDAIAVLTEAAKKIVLVVDGDNRLLGVLTDYDVRKSILDHVSFDEPVEKVMKSDPTVASAGTSEHEIISLLERGEVFQLPVVDSEGRLVDIHFVDEYLHMETHHAERVAVIMAGGLGTRLRPVTEQTPKPLLEVGGQPILFILIDQLLSERFDRIIVTLNYMSETIMASIDSVPRYKDKVEFVIEETALGTAGSLSLLPERPSAPFLLINADLVTNVSLQDMLVHHHTEGNMVTLATKRHTHDLPYGIVETDGTRITGLREKPQLNYFLNTGVYVIDPSVLERISGDEPVDMTDVIQDLIAAGQKVGSFAVHEYWIDIGNHDQYAQVQKDYPNHIHEKRD